MNYLMQSLFFVLLCQTYYPYREDLSWNPNLTALESLLAIACMLRYHITAPWL